MAAVASSPAAYGGASFLGLLVRRKTVLFGAIILIVVVAAALLSPWIAPYAPAKLSLANRLKPPSAQHLFGTDDFGRDVFSRVIVAGRTSLTVGFSVVIVSTVLGVILGLLAGFFRRLDGPIARVIDAMMAFPDILLAISLVAALGPSASNVILALGIVYAPRLARIIRASTLVIRELPYVEAARALGVSTPRIMANHVLRNLASPILVQGTFIFANAMLAEAGLSFLGVGVAPSTPTWGTMISQGRQFMDSAGWIMMFPGLAVVLSVLSLQLVGDGLRDMLDPRLSKDL
ncbi:peptide/nickel transport system permease protein [Faunimonas pinastri]|uniref:Peptide/nickel transport system permease protein n=1 Tax=Faunimonas pinastri TaxID=1855383 RepID=A0A1H9LCU5_9HYPH|nr:ABC transporter permease [Faunimonas pinastri]SER09190.1 peptide/nickel transport system permease protein [Faunimonas pinastri]